MHSTIYKNTHICTRHKLTAQFVSFRSVWSGLCVCNCSPFFICCTSVWASPLMCFFTHSFFVCFGCCWFFSSVFFLTSLVVLLFTHSLCTRILYARFGCVTNLASTILAMRDEHTQKQNWYA